MRAGFVNFTMFSADPGDIQTWQGPPSTMSLTPTAWLFARIPNGTLCVSEMWTPSLEMDSGAIAAPQPSADRLE
jgi:hypothetical protein